MSIYIEKHIEFVEIFGQMALFMKVILKIII